MSAVQESDVYFDLLLSVLPSYCCPHISRGRSADTIGLTPSFQGFPTLPAYLDVDFSDHVIPMVEANAVACVSGNSARYISRSRLRRPLSNFAKHIMPDDIATLNCAAAEQDRARRTYSVFLP
jgi:hypothetical protein